MQAGCAVLAHRRQKGQSDTRPVEEQRAAGLGQVPPGARELLPRHHSITPRPTSVMGGPDMAPQTPQRSGRPGAAVTALLIPTGHLGRRPAAPPPDRAPPSL